ncbi:MAG: DEAD/DEAH box helicase family protein [Thermodesulfobacteriota bacterium]|nr:DEAD/DEAH box helicase family protein [Thermodesulfobacteriota bacterium]
MFVLKDYQEWALEALHNYFQECSQTGDANVSFYSITPKTLRQGIHVPYNEVEELPGLPYVCLRIPTGGGKTIVACHSIGVAARELVHTDSPVVLWLVPSNAILEQTIQALRDRNHPYRQAVETTIGAVNVLDVEAALFVKRANLDGEATIIVTTMQAFRVEDTLGRRVYKDSGDLMDHFTGLPTHVADTLEKGKGGNTIHSFANVLRLRRPIVIVDEAHNARTSLSFETLARFNPSCIIEFTATPARENHASNVLYSASAADLKSAQMIKMPIRLDTRPDWKELLSDAIHCRNGLEKTASLEQQQTGEYIRPIMLIQAQPKRQGQETLSVEVVKQCLIEDHNIPEEHIAIATGATKELDGIDIFKSDVPIRYVITIQALREGWDCPFAYVLCSVAESRSATAIEQILGRVMRLPKAAWKNHEELNIAYAFATSVNFAEVANTLTDALVQSGFERQEAKDLIIPGRKDQMELPFDENEPFMGRVTVTMPEKPEIEKLSDEIRKKITFDDKEKKLSFFGAMSEEEREEIKAVCGTDESKAGVDQAFFVSTGKNLDEEKRTPSEKKVLFSVPVLSIKQGNLFEQFEETHFLDHHWELAKCDAFLSEEEYSSKRPDAQTGEIDITKNGKVAARFVSKLQSQMELFASDENWSVASLVHWLDRNIQHIDISQEDTGIFLTSLVQVLIEQRGLALEQLVLDKYRLKKVAEKKINQHRKDTRHKFYQALLFGEKAEVTVTPNICFSYAADPRKYVYSKAYRGGYEFKKHYYPEIGDLEPQGEEFECAQFIDQLDEVEFWVRNPVRRPGHCFWLQTSTDKFYPDFVCKLKDERVLVVEYKGGHLWNEDSKEKKALGELWAMRSDGACLFAMPTEKDYAAIQRVIASD